MVNGMGNDYSMYRFNYGNIKTTTEMGSTMCTGSTMRMASTMGMGFNVNVGMGSTMEMEISTK